MTRSLPLRVEPLPGESLTSWLCAYARRNEVTWRQMLTAAGLHRRRGDMKRLGWAARLHPHEIDALSTAAGVNPATLEALTLAQFDGLGISTGRRPSHPDFGTLRGARRPTRYCPQCLHDSDGRWQLRWSMGWTFACPRHRCLLADTCPECQRPPTRAAPLTDVVPDLSRCAQSGGHHGHTVCGADLRCHDPTTAATPGVLDAQRIIDRLIGGDTSEFSIYCHTRPTQARVLTDLRTLARHITEAPGAARHDDTSRQRNHHIDSEIARVADGFVAAIDTLRAADIPSAATALRIRWTAMPQKRCASRCAQSAIEARARSALIGAVELSALDAELPVIDVLRYRACSSRPVVPRRPAATLAKLTRALPTLLWPPWVAHILGAGAGAGAGTEDPVIRSMLSCAVAHVGTTASTRDIASMLGNTAVGPTGLCAALQRIEIQPDRREVLCRIIALADQITATTTQIDYHRRRELDYTKLLADIDAGLTDGGGDALRCLAFEHLSGLPLTRAPWFSDTPGFGRRCLEIAAKDPLQGPALVLALRQFLDRCGMGSEPITAVPPVPVLTAA